MICAELPMTCDGLPVTCDRFSDVSDGDALDIECAFKKAVPPMADPKTNDVMEKIVSLCKRRGFVFQSSEIYGGINGFWDYGPLGAELKRNVKELWWNTMTRQRDDSSFTCASHIRESSGKPWSNPSGMPEPRSV